MVSCSERLFLTFIRNLQNYSISRLLEACYLFTNMENLLRKHCWIILLLFFLFFTAKKELKQPSRAIIREKPTLCMKKKTIRKSSKPVLYYNNCSATHRLTLSGDIQTNPGPVNSDNLQTKPKSDRLPSSACQLCNETVQITPRG